MINPPGQLLDTLPSALVQSGRRESRCNDDNSWLELPHTTLAFNFSLVPI